MVYKKEKITWTYALNETNQLIKIIEALQVKAENKNAKFFCPDPACGLEYTPVNAKKRSKHFRHKVFNEDHRCTPETLEHNTAKRLIAEWINQGVSFVLKWACDRCNSGYCYTRLPLLKNAEIEKQYLGSKYRADVKALDIDSNSIHYFEVLETSKIDQYKSMQNRYWYEIKAASILKLTPDDASNITLDVLKGSDGSVHECEICKNLNFDGKIKELISDISINRELRVSYNCIKCKGKNKEKVLSKILFNSNFKIFIKYQNSKISYIHDIAIEEPDGTILGINIFREFEKKGYIYQNDWIFLTIEDLDNYISKKESYLQVSDYYCKAEKLCEFCEYEQRELLRIARARQFYKELFCQKVNQDKRLILLEPCVRCNQIAQEIFWNVPRYLARFGEEVNDFNQSVSSDIVLQHELNERPLIYIDFEFKGAGFKFYTDQQWRDLRWILIDIDRSSQKNGYPEKFFIKNSFKRATNLNGILCEKCQRADRLRVEQAKRELEQQKRKQEIERRKEERRKLAENKRKEQFRQLNCKVATSISTGEIQSFQFKCHQCKKVVEKPIRVDKYGSIISNYIYENQETESLIHIACFDKKCEEITLSIFLNYELLQIRTNTNWVLIDELLFEKEGRFCVQKYKFLEDKKILCTCCEDKENKYQKAIHDLKQQIDIGLNLKIDVNCSSCKKVMTFTYPKKLIGIEKYKSYKWCFKLYFQQDKKAIFLFERDDYLNEVGFNISLETDIFLINFNDFIFNPTQLGIKENSFNTVKEICCESCDRVNIDEIKRDEKLLRNNYDIDKDDLLSRKLNKCVKYKYDEHFINENFYWFLECGMYSVIQPYAENLLIKAYNLESNKNLVNYEFDKNLLKSGINLYFYYKKGAVSNSIFESLIFSDNLEINLGILMFLYPYRLLVSLEEFLPVMKKMDTYKVEFLNKIKAFIAKKKIEWKKCLNVNGGHTLNTQQRVNELYLKLSKL